MLPTFDFVNIVRQFVAKTITATFSSLSAFGVAFAVISMAVSFCVSHLLSVQIPDISSSLSFISVHNSLYRLILYCVHADYLVSVFSFFINCINLFLRSFFALVSTCFGAILVYRAVQNARVTVKDMVGS